MRTEEITALLQHVADTHVRPRFRALTGGEVIEKRPNDLVTVADREAEVALTDALLAAHPGCLVVGEENAFEHPEVIDGLAAAEHAFVVDPVDGTRNFVNGSPDHALMLAELRSGVVTRSWILQPEHGVTFVAERGAGVERNGVRVEPVARRAPFVGAASRRRWIGQESRDAKVVPTAWCCGVDYPRLLEGRTDFTWYLHGKPWDHLPGLLMLSEVGGDVRDPGDRRMRPGLNGPGLIAVAHTDVWPAAAQLYRRVNPNGVAAG